jgi:hypothetical protein
MTRRTRHWIAAASVAAAAAGGLTITAVASTPTTAHDTVTAVHGDTAKNPLNKNGWGDGTPGNTNIVLIGITMTGLD